MQVNNPYNKKLVHYSKDLRANATPGERLLWKFINKNQQGVKFRRQHPLLNYIVDFYCIKLRLAIEIDGSSHDEAKYLYDKRRQVELESVGVTFLRFTEHETRYNIESVLQTIELKVCELQI